MESPKWESYYHVRYVDEPKRETKRETISPQVEAAAKSSTAVAPQPSAQGG